MRTPAGTGAASWLPSRFVLPVMTAVHRIAPADRARGRRLLLLLIGVWLVNLFDLGFTLVACQQRLMTELNPLAQYVMSWGTPALIVYKFVLVASGSAILWWQRRRR